jgi:hypothetical protein
MKVPYIKIVNDEVVLGVCSKDYRSNFKDKIVEVIAKKGEKIDPKRAIEQFKELQLSLQI